MAFTKEINDHWPNIDDNVRFILHVAITVASQSRDQIVPQIVTLSIDWSRLRGDQMRPWLGSVIFAAHRRPSTPSLP